MESTNIYTAISEAMADIDAITKQKRNAQQGFMYRGVDDVMNELHPILCKHHIFVMPEVLEQEREERTTGKGGTLLYSRLKIKYTFYSGDGSSLSATVIGEGMDSGDKASNKAMSVAFKYAMFQTFCIPTEDMPDPDAETPPQSVPARVPHKQANKPQHVQGQVIIPSQPQQPQNAPQQPQERRLFETPKCEKCGKPISSTKGNDGKDIPADQIVSISQRRYSGHIYCAECMAQMKRNDNANKENK